MLHLRVPSLSRVFQIAVVLGLFGCTIPWIIPQLNTNVSRTPAKEEFEGLCCFNLTSRAEDVRQSIKKIRGMVHDMKEETKDWFDNIFDNWGLTGWIGSAVKTGLLILFLLLIIGIAFGLIKKSTNRLVAKATSKLKVNHVWVISPAPEEIEMQDLPPEEEDEEELSFEDFVPEAEEQWPVPSGEWPSDQQGFGDFYPETENDTPQAQFHSF